ncbi:MAG: hypothetical protein GY882_13020 [Actinomycetia bacterium]|nr:hypothetical protein [Actinomycetes bacterium]
MTEALEAVLAAYERATGAAAVVVNRQVLEGVIVDAQARGCSAQDLLAATTGDYAGARNPAGVLVGRLRAVSPAPASDPGDAGAEVAARVRRLVQNWAATGIDRDAIVEHSTASMPAASKADVEAAVDLELAATELTA